MKQMLNDELLEFVQGGCDVYPNDPVVELARNDNWFGVRIDGKNEPGENQDIFVNGGAVW